jgi:hypothetical protein
MAPSAADRATEVAADQGNLQLDATEINPLHAFAEAHPALELPDDRELLKKTLSAEESGDTPRPTTRIPPYWTPISVRPDDGGWNTDSVLKYELLPESTEYKHVADKFHDTCARTRYTVTSVCRVQNFTEWNLFQEKARMLKARDEVGANMQELFHGTEQFVGPASPRQARRPSSSSWTELYAIAGWHGFSGYYPPARARRLLSQTQEALEGLRQRAVAAPSRCVWRAPPLCFGLGRTKLCVWPRSLEFGSAVHSTQVQLSAHLTGARQKWQRRWDGTRFDPSRRLWSCS